jgi:lysophospholipase L1-like esterase
MKRLSTIVLAVAGLAVSAACIQVNTRPVDVVTGRAAGLTAGPLAPSADGSMSSAGTSVPPAGRTTIVVIGDSILMSSWQEVHRSLAAGGRYTPAMMAKPASGLATTAWFDWDEGLRALDAEARPDQVVVELGTNDLEYPGFYESGAAVGLVMRATRARRVVWLLPSATPLRPDRQVAMGRIRAALVHAASNGPYADRLDVADFGLVVTAEPGALAPDLIHVTPYGSQLLGELVRDSVDGRRPPPAPR